MIMTQMEARFEDNTLFQLKKIAKKYSESKGNIVMVISHLDIIRREELEKTLKNLEESIKEIGLSQVPFVLCSNKE